MDLLRLLEIDRSLIGPEAQRSLLVAERVWCEEGCPREAWALVAALEKILRRCAASNIWYAPVLLQRKKALERGTWRPLVARPPAPTLQCKVGDPAGPFRTKDADPTRGTSPAAVPRSPQEATEALRPAGPGATDSAEPPCEKCGGAGIVNAPNGLHGMLCECGSYMRRFAKKA